MMKEKLADLMGNLTERIRSPFFFSFCISWMFIHWKIILVLFFYSNEELLELHNIAKLDFIASQLGWYNSFCLPFSLAVGYIIVFKIGYNWVAGVTQRAGNFLFMKGSAKSLVGIETVIKIREQYEEREQALTNLLRSQEEREAELDRLKTVNANQLVEIDRYRTERDSSFLEGRWDVEMTFNPYNVLFSPQSQEYGLNNKTISCQNNIIDVQKPLGGNDRYGTIEIFRFYSYNKSVFLVIRLEGNEPQTKYEIWNFYMSSNRKTLEGHIDGAGVVLKRTA